MNDAAEASQTDFVKWLAGREQASLEEVSHFLQTEQNPQAVVNRLVEQGVIVETTEKGQTWYQVRFAARRRRQVPAVLGQALDHSEQVAARESDAAQPMKPILSLRPRESRAQVEQAPSWPGLGPRLHLFCFSIVL